MHEANLIARQLILLDNNNEDAWLVLLASAMLNNDLSVIREFEKLNDKEKYTIIDYVFYENGQLIKNNENIAKRLFNLVQEKEFSIFSDGILRKVTEFSQKTLLTTSLRSHDH